MSGVRSPHRSRNMLGMRKPARERRTRDAAVQRFATQDRRAVPYDATYDGYEFEVQWAGYGPLPHASWPSRANPKGE